MFKEHKKGFLAKPSGRFFAEAMFDVGQDLLAEQTVQNDFGMDAAPEGEECRIEQFLLE